MINHTAAMFMDYIQEEAGGLELPPELWEEAKNKIEAFPDIPLDVALCDELVSSAIALYLLKFIRQREPDACEEVQDALKDYLCDTAGI